MTRPDIKKLITIFLVVSALVSSSALIFLSIGASTPAPQSAVANEEERAAPKNAFVEPLPADATNNQLTNNTLTAGTPSSNNLTENLASNLAQEIVKANPDGPQTVDTSGNPSIAAPDINAVSAQFTKTASAQLAKIPDWESDAAKLQVITATSDTQDAADAYLASINGIITKLAEHFGVTDPASQTAAVNDFEDARLALDRALRDAQKIPAPRSLAALHKSLTKLFVYGRNTVALATDGSDDPIRASIIFNAQAVNYDRAMLAFKTEFQKQSVKKNASLSPHENRIVAFVKDLLEIKTAHAFWPVFDFRKFLADVKKSITDKWHQFVLEQTKDQLIHRLVNNVINWVQGGGKPKFITNWKGFLSDAGNNAAGNVLYNLDKNHSLCSSFGTQIKLAFQPVNTFDYGVSCTLDRVVSNVQNFYNDFRTGGWLAYGAALQPSNNFFGSLIQVHDAVNVEAAKAQEAKRQEALAGQGFKPTKICEHASADGFITVPLEPGSQGPEQQISYVDQLTKTGQDSITIPSPIPDGFVGPVLTVYCEVWSNTSPAATIASQLNQAIGSPIARIVNAQDFTNLVTALVNSGLQHLINAGVKGITNGLNGGGGDCKGLTGTALATCQNGGSAGTPDTTVPASERCRFFTGDALTACRSGGDLSGDKERLTTLADGYATSWQTYANDNNDWLNGAQTVAPKLQSLQTSCSAIASAAASNLAFINNTSNAVRQEYTDAQAALDGIAIIRNDIQNAASASELTAASNDLNQYDTSSVAVTDKMQTTSARATQMQSLITALNANACPSSIPSLEATPAESNLPPQ